MLAVGIFLIAASGALAVYHVMFAGNTLSTDGLAAHSATGGVVCIGIITLAVNDFLIGVFAGSATLLALAGGPIPVMLAVGIFLVATLGALTVYHVVLAGNRHKADGLEALSTAGGLVCLGIVALAVNDFLRGMLAVDAALLALAVNLIPVMVAVRIGLISAKSDTLTIFKGMGTRNRSTAKGLLANGAPLSVVLSGISAVAVDSSHLMIASCAAIGAVTGDAVVSVVSTGFGFNSTTNGTDTVGKAVSSRCMIDSIQGAFVGADATNPGSVATTGAVRLLSSVHLMVAPSLAARNLADTKDVPVMLAICATAWNVFRKGSHRQQSQNHNQHQQCCKQFLHCFVLQIKFL